MRSLNSANVTIGVAPVEVPVGPFLVLLGVPIFLWLLRKAV